MARTLTLCVVTAVMSACGVNEFDRYRARIASVKVQTQVAAGVALEVADPAVVAAPGAEDPATAAQRTTESYIITSLRDKLEHFVAPESLALVFDRTFAADVAHGTSWSLVEEFGAADVRVVATISGFGVRVDSLGLADVYFRMQVRAWVQPEDKLIYEDWSVHDAPLPVVLPAPHYHSDDPNALAAERAYNLLVLNDIAGVYLREMIYDLAEDAAALLARQLVVDSLR